MPDLTAGIETLLSRLGSGRRQDDTAPPEAQAAIDVPPEAGSDVANVVARVLMMPLDQFADEGQSLEVRVPGLDVTLWFVPQERDGDALGREGVSRGRVWTARELMALMAVHDRRLEVVGAVTRAKLAFEADIVEVLLAPVGAGGEHSQARSC